MNTWINGKYTPIKVETSLEIAKRIITCILYDLQMEPRILRLQKYLPELLKNNIFTSVMLFIFKHYPERLSNILYLQMGDMISTGIENIYEVYIKEVKPIISNKEIFKKRIAVIFGYENDEHFIFFSLDAYTETIEQELNKFHNEAIINFLQNEFSNIVRMIIEMATSDEKLPPLDNESTRAPEIFMPLYRSAPDKIQIFCDKVWNLCCSKLLCCAKDEQYITQAADIIKFLTTELQINNAAQRLSKLAFDISDSLFISINRMDIENELINLTDQQIPAIINTLNHFNTIVSSSTQQIVLNNNQKLNYHIENAVNGSVNLTQHETSSRIDISQLSCKIWENICWRLLNIKYRWLYSNKIDPTLHPEILGSSALSKIIFSFGKKLNINNIYTKAMQISIFKSFYLSRFTSRDFVLEHIMEDFSIIPQYIEAMARALSEAEGFDQKSVKEIVTNLVQKYCQELWIDAIKSEIVYAYINRKLINIDQTATYIALLAHQLKVNNIISSIRPVVVTLLISPHKNENLNYQNIMQNAELTFPDFPLFLNRLFNKLRVFEIDRSTFIPEPSVKEWCYQPVWQVFCTELIMAVHDKKGTLTIEQLAKILIWYAKQFEFEDVITQVKAVTDTLPTEQVNSELMWYLRDLTVSKEQVESIGFYLGNINPHKVIEKNQQENHYAVRPVGI